MRLIKSKLFACVHHIKSYNMKAVPYTLVSLSEKRQLYQYTGNASRKHIETLPHSEKKFDFFSKTLLTYGTSSFIIETIPRGKTDIGGQKHERGQAQGTGAGGHL